MNKKNIAIILELIPIVSALISFVLFKLEYDSEIITSLIDITILLSFLGFIFFFIGRKLDKDDNTVKVLGILDWFATVYVIVFYTIAIFGFGL